MSKNTEKPFLYIDLRSGFIWRPQGDNCLDLSLKLLRNFEVFPRQRKREIGMQYTTTSSQSVCIINL